MKTFFRYIGLILKGIWKGITLIRKTLTNLIFVGIIVVFFIALNQSDDDQDVTLEPSALVLNLSGPIVEKTSHASALDSLSSSVLGDSLPQENLLFDIVKVLRAAKDDDTITGVVLKLGNLPETPLNKLNYIAKAIDEFKSGGKPVFATGDFYNQSQYYLASFADKIFMAPHGGILFKGYSSYPLYYQKLLDKLDVTAHVFRVGTYKSAVEPFLRNDMSPSAKEANSVWLNQLWSSYLAQISQNRDISEDTLDLSQAQFIEKFSQADGNLAKFAMNLGLVDQLASRPQTREELAKIFGHDHEGSYNHIGYYEYLSSLTKPLAISKNEIAVIVANGAIMDGRQPANKVGGDDIAAKLRQARFDRNIRAVVLRVDSPGGSAFASEVIRNEIEALKLSKKPVVVSMSSLAASGGYWISMSGDKIIASPTTLTGSIGIFSVIPTFEKAANKLGISSDGVGTSPFSGEGVINGLSFGAKQAMQMAINNGYKTFISLVAENRDMRLSEVDRIAQGRVWTGKDAQKIGLVDQLGNFDDAVAVAASLAELDHYELEWMEEPLPMAEQILNQLLANADAQLALKIKSYMPSALLGVSNQVLADSSLLSNFNDPKGQYAFCLNCNIQ